MRHNKKINHLGRKKAHRLALLQNLSIALISSKRIHTTLAKAKALRRYVEPILTKSKSDTISSRRNVFKLLQNKQATKQLFGDISTKIASRNGGYTRVIRTFKRKGDAADMAFIELVDYNEEYKCHVGSSQTTKRSRRGSGSSSSKKKDADE